MSKLKARIDQAVAGDLGVELSSRVINLQEIAANPDNVDELILAYIVDDNIYYDRLPVWRYVNGMRIKLPKFQSRPIIEARLTKQLYKRYYAVIDGKLHQLKISKPSDLKLRLPFRITEEVDYRSNVVSPDDLMGLRKKALLFHRRQPRYEL